MLVAFPVERRAHHHKTKPPYSQTDPQPNSKRKKTVANSVCTHNRARLSSQPQLKRIKLDLYYGMPKSHAEIACAIRFECVGIAVNILLLRIRIDFYRMMAVSIITLADTRNRVGCWFCCCCWCGPVFRFVRSLGIVYFGQFRIVGTTKVFSCSLVWGILKLSFGVACRKIYIKASIFQHCKTKPLVPATLDD